MNYTTIYSYDLAGNLTGITDANTHTTTFTYDALNRKTGEHYPSGIPKTYSYDAVGNMITRTDGNGITHYNYDSMNRLTLTRDALLHETGFAREGQLVHRIIGEFRPVVIFIDKGRDITRGIVFKLLHTLVCCAFGIRDLGDSTQ